MERKFWYDAVENGDLVCFLACHDIRNVDDEGDTMMTECCDTIFLKGLPVMMADDNFQTVRIETPEQLEQFLDDSYDDWDIRTISVYPIAQ